MRAIPYFAYGSNMLTARLRARVASARPIAPAWIASHALGFGKRGLDGSGKATIAPDRAAWVHGVLFEVRATEMPALDGFEGPGYSRETRRVATSAGPRAAAVYLARPDHLDPTGAPYEWYLALIRAGAREHGLPPGWRAELDRVPAIPDPLPNRPTRLEALRLLDALPRD